MLDGEYLLCPACKGDFIHHDTVDVFERCEDEVDGLHVRVASSVMGQDRDLAGNPSSRRHGLVIAFWCEQCGVRSRLTIAQHKGQTLVNWADGAL